MAVVTEQRPIPLCAKWRTAKPSQADQIGTLCTSASGFSASRLGPHNRFYPRTHSQILKHPLQVLLHRAGADAEGESDVFVRESLSQPRKYRLFTLRQPVTHARSSRRSWPILVIERVVW